MTAILAFFLCPFSLLIWFTWHSFFHSLSSSVKVLKCVRARSLRAQLYEIYKPWLWKMFTIWINAIVATQRTEEKKSKRNKSVCFKWRIQFLFYFWLVLRFHVNSCVLWEVRTNFQCTSFWKTKESFMLPISTYSRFFSVFAYFDIQTSFGITTRISILRNVRVAVIKDSIQIARNLVDC